MTSAGDSSVVRAYDARAQEYADLLGSMDSVDATDRRFVERWADSVSGPMLDAGCGPGHWIEHLARRGHDIRGIDPSQEFVALARREHPSRRFDLARIEALPLPPASCGGVLSWFSLIHHDPAHVPAAVREIARVLRPGGSVLVGFFEGPTVEAFDHAVTRAYRWPSAELADRLTDAGFTVVDTHRRTADGERPTAALWAELSARGEDPAPAR